MIPKKPARTCPEVGPFSEKIMLEQKLDFDPF
jgi:hypothetical protein